MMFDSSLFDPYPSTPHSSRPPLRRRGDGSTSSGRRWRLSSRSIGR